MVDFKKRGKLHQRRGISTIVGSAIFLILFASATSTFFIAMEAQRDTINSQRAISDAIIEKTKEKFSIAPSIDETNGNLLGIQVKNLGTNPVEIDDIWIVNNSGSFPAKKHLIDYKDSVIPPGYGSNILENTRLTMLPDDYDIKVVSTLGTIEKSKFNVGGNNYLRATLLAIPPDVKVNKNVTLTMHVENIGDTRLLNVAPALDVPNISVTLDPPVPPTPTPVDLDPGESVFFTWQYKVKGFGLTAGDKITFDNYADANIEDMPPTVVVKSNNVQESIKLLEPDSSDIIVLTQDLLAKPETFMVIPSPFGSDGEKGLWGVNIVNPTPVPVEVSKVTISLVTPRAQSNDKIFNTNTCAPQTVAPTTADWSCPAENQLMWKNVANPQIIPPYSVFPFLAKVTPGTLAGLQDSLESILVQADVFTTLGEFGKSGYGTSMKNEGSAVANIYLSTVPGSTSSNNILSRIISIPSGEQVVFNATIADFDTSGTKFIDENSRIIINVPKGWTVNTASINTFGDFTWTHQSFSDTSSQIVGTLSGDITGSGGVAKTIKFRATAPEVESTQMYVMYILADGTVTDGDFTLGPLAEIVLQVIP